MDLQRSDGEEPERRNDDGDEDHAGHSQHRASGQVDLRVSQQPEHQARDQDHFQHEGQDSQDVEFVDVPVRRNDHRQHRHHQGLERVQAHLGAQQRGAEHGELGQQDQDRDHVCGAGIG
jgi:inhibitor of KinA sporulation pathway (predicted exonuclease)